jgi:AraC-like DNA-binding protein
VLITGRLHTLFRAETGETPAEYVLRQRLERSADMLRNGAVSIASIADRFGFSSSQNFARSFRKYFRMTPTAYRRASGGKQ